MDGALREKRYACGLGAAQLHGRANDSDIAAIRLPSYGKGVAHHKRRRLKSRRAGCLLCKPYKANGARDKSPPSARRRMQDDDASV